MSHCDDCAPEFNECWNDGSKCRKRPPGSFAATTGSVLIGMCNCGHFEPQYEKHATCAHCGKPWRVMPMINALYYLHNIYEDEQKLKRYWKERCETLNSAYPTAVRVLKPIT